MNNFIKIQKLWRDKEIIQLKVICSSELITATAKIYVSDNLIDELIYQINRFLEAKVTESIWSNEFKGDDSSTCVSFRFLHKDKLGHLLIEVYLEIDDGGRYSKHNCCFYIKTETGLLLKFCENLSQLKSDIDDVSVNLNV